MELTEWIIVVLTMAGASFISGVGVKLSGEFIDYIKRKRTVLKEFIQNGKPKDSK